MSTALAAAASPLLPKLARAETAATTKLKGNIKHSACKWCYKNVTLEDLCAAGKDKGLVALDLIAPGSRWLSRRAPMSIVHAGHLLDHEMCTLDGALSGRPDDPAARWLVEALRGGRFGYVQSSASFACGEVPGVREAIAACFEPVAVGDVWFDGRKVTVAIQRYDGARAGCRPPPG